MILHGVKIIYVWNRRSFFKQQNHLSAKSSEELLLCCVKMKQCAGSFSNLLIIICHVYSQIISFWDDAWVSIIFLNYSECYINLSKFYLLTKCSFHDGWFFMFVYCFIRLETQTFKADCTQVVLNFYKFKYINRIFRVHDWFKPVSFFWLILVDVNLQICIL